MSTLALVTALAAQATAPSGSTTPPAETATSRGAERPAVTTFVDLEAAAGYSTNPVQQIVGSTGAGFGRFSINAVHSLESPRTSTSISAYAQDIIYSRRNGSEFSADLRANHSARVSEKLSIYGSLDGSIDTGGQLDTRILGVPTVPVVPGIQPPPIVLLPGQDTLFVRGRQYFIRADGGGSLTISTRDSMNFRLGVEHLISKNGGFKTTYTSFPLSFGYDRTLSARTTVGLGVEYQHTAYNGPASFWDVSPRLTVRQRLSERLTLSASVGPSFATTDNGLTKTHSTGLAGNASLCSDTGERTQFCGGVSLNQQSATAFGASRSISANINYSRQLDANQTLRFSIDGSHYASPTLLVTGTSFSNSTYVRGAADYTRRFGGRRWYGGATLSARKLTEPGPDPKMDFSGSLFIRYRLGDNR